MKKDCVSASFQKKARPSSIPRAVSFLHFTSLTKRSLTKRQFRSDGELASVSTQQDSDIDNWTYTPLQRNAVSNLDEESKWTVHYKASWHQHENVFLPASRSTCVEDLHRQAKGNLKTVLRDCDKLRKDGFRSSQYYSQGPIFASSSSHLSASCLDEEEDQERMSTVSPPDEEMLYNSRRPKTPVSSDLSEIDVQTNWTKALPLPTPEERMRQQAQAVQSDVIPINVTGENFDRQAGTRRSLVRSDTALRRPTRIKRRKTITGLPDTVQKELGSGQTQVRGHSVILPGQYSTISRLESSRSTRVQSATKDSSCQTDEVKVVPPSVRRIRAQKGQGIAAQLSNSSGNMSTASSGTNAQRASGELRFHSLPRPGARVSLHELDDACHALRKSEKPFGTLPGRVGKLRVDGSATQLRTSPLTRPKSQEIPGHQATGEEPARMVRATSPSAVCPTQIIAHTTLSSKAEVVAIRTSQGRGGCPLPPGSPAVTTPLTAAVLDSAGGLKEEHCSSSGNWSGSSGDNGGSLGRHSPTSDTVLPPSRCDSAVSLALGLRVDLAEPPHARDRAGVASECRLEDRSGTTEKRPVCETPRRAGTSSPETQAVNSGSRAPVCHTYKTSDHPLSSPLAEVGWNSLYPEVQYPPAEVAARSQGGGKGRRGLESQTEYSDRSLGRSISLKKTKKPPLPPARMDSLRKKAKGARPVLSESLIATLQRSFEVNLKSQDSPSASPSEGRDPWAMRSRSQSNASAGGGSSNSSGHSTAASNSYSTSAATPSQSETSSLRSEYSDPWAYYTEGAGGRTQDLAPRANAWDYTQDELPRACTPLVTNASAKPKSPSPDKSHGITSPSSGYSSQCNTPTMLNPAPVFSHQRSPGPAKPKPKVPERKSSLLSSVSASSSSASLSSNTSDSRHPVVDNRTAPSNTLPAFSMGPPLPPPPPPLCTLPPPAAPLIIRPLPSLLPPPASPLPLPSVAKPALPPPAPHLPPPSASLSTPPPAAFPLPPPSTSLSTPPPAASPLPPPAPSLSKPPPPAPPLPLPAPSLSKPPPPAPPLPPPAPALSKPPLPATPLNLKMADSAKQSPTQFCRNGPKTPAEQAEAYKPATGKPLITPSALQMVQLRSVRRSERADPPKQVQKLSPWLKPQPEQPVSPPPRKPAVLQRPSSLCRLAKHNEVSNVPDRGPALRSESKTGSTDWPETSAHPNRPGVSSGNELGPMVDSAPTAPSKGNKASNDAEQERALHPEKPNAKSASRMPPPIARKPKLSLLVPPSPRSLLPLEKRAPVSLESVTEDMTTSVTVSAETNGDQSSAQSVEVTESDNSHIAGTPEDTVQQEAWDVDVESLLIESRKNLSVKEELAADDSNTWDSMEDSSELTCQGDEMGDVFEPSSPILAGSYGWSNDEPSTPTRPRTTEDLFAAIHRSKRRVLGRKDSEDELSRTVSPSPPVTPVGTASSPGNSKQVGSIQRNLRKSSTSSDSFKALLLKKGSRAEAGCRMSAAEMLRSTDPRHRPGEPPQAETARANGWSATESRSPGHRGRNPREEWASQEGPMPRGAGLVGIRHARSRTPPSAASSRYSARHLHLHRLHSSPMTVICEGEAENSEVTEGQSPGDDGRRHSEGDIISSSGLERIWAKEPKGNGITSAPASQNLPDSTCGAADIYSAQNGFTTLSEKGANQDWDS
ncbi:NHS-like protein 1 isoform X2 [Scyliorhinus torazame]|uniref:NHS-like protein 1 isoform X2 n=1 Tax=Scyliorhinus torazame TaxID=75743 RepID=UPI003B59ED3A